MTAVAGGLGIVLLLALVLSILTRQHQRAKNEESVTAAVMAAVPSAAAAPAAAPKSDDASPFAGAQNDPKGFDGYAWDTPIAGIAKRGDKVTQTFSDDSAADGPPGLPTIVWIGIGLPPNHQIAQAATFNPDSFPPGEFSTVRRGATQYIFDKGRFIMAVAGIPASSLERVRQKMDNTYQEIPSLHVDQTFDLSSPGSGLPPEALSSDCYKKGDTNTRIYVIEKWSTSVAGTIMNDHAFVVTIPNSDYLALLDLAQHPK